MAQKQSDERHRRVFAPVDLDSVPAVNSLLARIGVGHFAPETVTAPTGRNNAWAGHTVDRHPVFVKQLLGAGAELDRRMARMLAFESFADALPDDAIPRPALLGVDAEAHLVAFELVENATDGAELMVEEAFTASLAAEVGRHIARLHMGPPPAEAAASFPPVALFDGIPLALFEQASAGMIETWRLLQGDVELADGVRRLRGWGDRAPKVPTHGDFRVDQLLVRDETVLITDWEEFRAADGARDVGAFAGEWLFRSVLDIVTTRGGDDDFAEWELTHEAILARGAEKMARLVPLTEAFWAAYRELRGEPDPTFATRATAYAGWHLIDRLMASADMAGRLSGICRAAAGIGRGALLAPERYREAIGLP